METTPTYAVPAFEQARAALMQLFADKADGFLRAMGAPLLLPTAFVPVTRTEPTSETVCVAWSGANRDPDGWSYRDSDLLVTVNIWAFGDDDVTAQQRAIQIETALIASLDQDQIDCRDSGATAYVNGTMCQPPVIGPTRCVTPENTDSLNMTWHALFPVLCPLNTARPEFAPVSE